MKASRFPEAAFLAARTANATHEIRNVLAIIKESAGLMEDLVHLCSERGTLDPEKLARAVQRVDTQVKRGAEILTNLNRLSHALDQEIAALDLHEELQQVVSMSIRPARKKAQTVEAGPGGSETLITTHPLRLQMLLFEALERCLEAYPPGSSITMEAGTAEGKPQVRIIGKTQPPGGEVFSVDDAGWVHLQEVAESVGAEVGILEGLGGVRISFNS